MKSSLLYSASVCVVAAAAGFGTLSGQSIIAGSDPVTDVGSVDGWTNILYINESETFDFSATGEAGGIAYEFRFWADKDAGTVTPFVAEVVGPDEFVVRAIGTTRRGGVDWTGSGLQSFDFLEGGAAAVQHGWAAGFISSTPEGEESGSPIPFASSNVEGWLTGTSSEGSGSPAIMVGEAPVPGGTGTDPDAYGKRKYAFQIAATRITALPPTDIRAVPATLTAGLTAGSIATELVAVDGNALDAHVFSLVPGAGSTDNSLFSIDGARLKAAAALGGDGTAYSVRLRVQDSTGLVFERALALAVLGNRPPTAVRLSQNSIVSLLPAGSVIATLIADDPNSIQGETHVFELVPGEGADDNLSFTVEENRLVIQVEPEGGRLYRFRVRATDSTGLMREEALVLSVVAGYGNSLAPRSDAPTDTATVPILYTNGVPMPGPGTVDAVLLPLQSEAQLNLAFHVLLARPSDSPGVYSFLADSGEMAVTGAVGGVITLVFPNGPITVSEGDVFFHYGRGIPFDANRGNALPIWYPCPILPAMDEPLDLGTGTPDFPLRADLPRDYAWAVRFSAGAAGPLEITAMALNPATRAVTLTWRSTPGSQYRIVGSTTLAQWAENVETDIPAAAGNTTAWTFGPVELPGVRFYRVEKTQ